VSKENVCFDADFSGLLVEALEERKAHAVSSIGFLMNSYCSLFKLDKAFFTF
jgi:hypothetical protein